MKNLILLTVSILGMLTVSCSKDSTDDILTESGTIQTFAEANNDTKWQSTTYEDSYDGIEADTQLTIAIGGGSIFNKECKSNNPRNFLKNADEITVNNSRKIEYTSSYYNELDKYQSDTIGSITITNGKMVAYYEFYENGVLAYWSKITYKKVNEFDCK